MKLASEKTAPPVASHSTQQGALSKPFSYQTPMTNGEASFVLTFFVSFLRQGKKENKRVYK
jgi:hypothetical protein